MKYSLPFKLFSITIVYGFNFFGNNYSNSIYYFWKLSHGYQNYVSYPDKICDHPEENWYYVFVNEDILMSPRMESYNSYSKNKDMYSLNRKILKSKKCDPNQIPTTFH